MIDGRPVAGPVLAGQRTPPSTNVEDVTPSGINNADWRFC